jgi:hypothetical protein
MGTFLRIAVIVAIGGFIMLGIRRIWMDWTGRFKEIDKETHARDVAERGRPDVITLQRDKDGTFRPPEDKDGR